MNPRTSPTVCVKLTFATSLVPSPSLICKLVVGKLVSTEKLGAVFPDATGLGEVRDELGKAPGGWFVEEEEEAEEGEREGVGAPSRFPEPSQGPLGLGGGGW
jgi:hypothetical protein